MRAVVAGKDVHIEIIEPSVSRHHAVLTVHEGFNAANKTQTTKPKVTITDTASTFGTFVENRKVISLI